MILLQPLFRHKATLFFCISSCLMLSACGGGSNDSGNSSGGSGGTTPTNYTVTASAGAGGSISPGSRSAQSGQTTTFNVTANEGYSIENVSGCGGSLSGTTYTTGAITSACSVSASFSQNSFTVTASAGEGGSISPETVTVAHGESSEFALTANEGYSIENVSGCGGSLSGTTYTTGAITSACSVSASFSLNSYTVTASAGEGGSISPDSALVNHGSTTTFNVVEEPGFGIADVVGCEGSLAGNTYTTGEILQPCEVTASFVVILTAPENLTSVAGDSQLTLSWDEASGAEGYHLYYDTQPDIDPENYASTGTGEWIQNVSSPFTLTELSNDVEYFAVVTAFLGNAESPASNEISAVPFAPEPVVLTLNDSGIDWCADGDTINLDCPVTGFEGQDAEYGRDALARTGELTKVGDGAAGFDFTKLDTGGNDLPASASAWSCVRDNHTGLVWEVKTTGGGLHDMDHTYTWYNPDNSVNGGNAGTESGGNCNGSDCDTYSYVQAVNNQELCGFNDWRMPTRNELLNIMHNGKHSQVFDADYFPNMGSSVGKWYWSSSPFASLSSDNYAWSVYFTNGRSDSVPKYRSYRVKLVRTGQ
ncbi:MAG: DUF1566 domain-containing protein [Alkalimonas sp.]|nr:DUF1566 domain-containing protein [Alkalimonas sp.]